MKKILSIVLIISLLLSGCGYGYDSNGNPINSVTVSNNFTGPQGATGANGTGNVTGNFVVTSGNASLSVPVNSSAHSLNFLGTGDMVKTRLRYNDYTNELYWEQWNGSTFVKQVTVVHSSGNSGNISTSDFQWVFVDGKLKAINPVISYTERRSKSFTGSWDSANATSSLSFTGFGFKPTSIILFAGISNGIFDGHSQGSSDSELGTTCMYLLPGGNFGTWSSTNVYIAYVELTAGNRQTATLVSYDTDGFTVTMTKTGSLTGTIYFSGIAYK